MSDAVLPPVDIIIAARNEATEIGACLDGLRRQDYPADKLRVVVVDNGSSDGTAAIARAQGATVLSHDPLGAGGARNLGIRQSQAPLIGLLDAHCIANPEWVRLMVRAFGDPHLGGCQGTTASLSVSPRVQRYLTRSGALSNQRILEDSVGGKRNLYPWLLSGNSMYRKAALTAAGLFDEQLPACEDVDLAWRIVLLGYRVGYVRGALVAHHDGSSWPQFVRKGFTYAQGAAMLAHAYRLHGARSKFVPPRLRARYLESFLGGLAYWAGYWWKDLRIRCGLDAVRDCVPVRPVQDDFRPWFSWAGAVRLRISPDVVYWFRDDERASVIVHLPSRVRVVLDTTADVIWRLLAGESSRQAVAGALVREYDIAAVTAASDLDDLIEELVEARVLLRASIGGE